MVEEDGKIDRQNEESEGPQSGFLLPAKEIHGPRVDLGHFRRLIECHQCQGGMLKEMLNVRVMPQASCTLPATVRFPKKRQCAQVRAGRAVLLFLASARGSGSTEALLPSRSFLAFRWISETRTVAADVTRRTRGVSAA